MSSEQLLVDFSCPISMMYYVLGNSTCFLQNVFHTSSGNGIVASNFPSIHTSVVEQCTVCTARRHYLPLYSTILAFQAHRHSSSHQLTWRHDDCTKPQMFHLNSSHCICLLYNIHTWAYTKQELFEYEHSAWNMLLLSNNTDVLKMTQ